MKRLLAVLTLIGAIALSQTVRPASAEPQEKVCTLKVEGMTCGMCERKVQKALQKAEGVKTTRIHLGDRTAEVTFLEGKTSPEQLAKIVTEAGYEAKVVAPKTN